MLLAHWLDARRDRRLFFCQVEVAETAIFLGEVAQRGSAAWLFKLDAASREQSNVLRPSRSPRAAARPWFMAMLIAWEALNQLANTRDARFATAFLVVSPSITIRDRLRVRVPPVFIVLSAIPPSAKLVYDHVVGYERPLPGPRRRGNYRRRHRPRGAEHRRQARPPRRGRPGRTPRGPLLKGVLRCLVEAC